jgi:hypothetical protein
MREMLTSLVQGKVLIFLAVFFTPIVWKMLGTVAIVTLDTVLALYLVYKGRLKWDDAKAGGWFNKNFVYLSAIMLARAVELMLELTSAVPLMTIIISFIIMREFKSIDDKYKTLTGFTIYEKVKGFLSKTK